MKGVRVDPANRTVRVGAGCTTGDVDHATHAFGLAVPFGIVSTTGVARPDAQRRPRLSQPPVRPGHRQPDRGRRGAGRRQFRHREQDGQPRSPLGAARRRRQFRRRHQLPVPGAPREHGLWRPDLLGVERRTQDHALVPRLPGKRAEEFYIFLGLQTVPPGDPFPKEHWGKKMCVLLVSHNGPPGTARRRSTPSARHFRSRSSIVRARCPYPALQGMFDALYPKGLQWYWKGDFVKTLPDAAIDAHIEHAAKVPSAVSCDASLSDRWRRPSQGAKTKRPGTAAMPPGRW